METDDYLLPNFDPTSLRVAELRRILLFHDVNYPSSAKKADLVHLFLDNIPPKAPTILQKKRTVRPIPPKMEFVDENGDIGPLIFLPNVQVE